MNIHGGCSLQNRSERFQEVASEVPGPGAYHVTPALEKTAGAAFEKPGRQRVGSGLKKTDDDARPDLISVNQTSAPARVNRRSHTHAD